MPFINFPAREINCKLVYYGPGLGGKTANLQWIYDHTGSNQKGKMVSLATETDRTLFFDFLPLDLGTVRGRRDHRSGSLRHAEGSSQASPSRAKEERLAERELFDLEGQLDRHSLINRVALEVFRGTKFPHSYALNGFQS